jgi:hypothetical protein
MGWYCQRKKKKNKYRNPNKVRNKKVEGISHFSLFCS